MTLSGCSGIFGGNEAEEFDPRTEEFQYFFEDETGTLGSTTEGQEPPEDAEDWQIIHNDLEESDWRRRVFKACINELIIINQSSTK